MPGPSQLKRNISNNQGGYRPRAAWWTNTFLSEEVLKVANLKNTSCFWYTPTWKTSRGSVFLIVSGQIIARSQTAGLPKMPGKFSGLGTIPSKLPGSMFSWPFSERVFFLDLPGCFWRGVTRGAAGSYLLIPLIFWLTTLQAKKKRYRLHWRDFIQYAKLQQGSCHQEPLFFFSEWNVHWVFP